jgi:superfamily II DNA or RNA helicase
MQLYPEQKRTKQAIYDFLKEGGMHCIAYGPPRFGKTVIFSSIANDFAKNGRKILIITDRTELLDQSGKTLKNFDLPVFYIEAGCRYVNKNYSVYVGMTRTIENRVGKKYWDEFLSDPYLTIIIDECHIQNFNHLFQHEWIWNKWVIGFTGTPPRQGKQRQLGLDYETIVKEVTIKELLERGRLVNCDIATSTPPDTSDVGIDSKTGDYKTNELYQKFDSRNLYKGVVRDYSDNVYGTKFICYCINKTHAINTAIEFYRAGVDVRFLVSGSNEPKKPTENAGRGAWVRYEERLKDYELYKKWFPILSGKRSEIIQDFRDNKFTGIVNVEILTKGFNCPDVETIILNYKTKSLTKYLQSALRGATACGDWKTHFNIRDFGDNYAEFGDPLKDREFSLWHYESNKEGLPPVKECGYNTDGKPINTNGRKGCRRLIPASYKICPFPDCGFKYPEKNLQETELQQIMTVANSQKAVKTKRVKDMTIDELIEYRKNKKHNVRWLWRQLWHKGGEQALWQAAKKEGWKTGAVYKAKQFCRTIK